MRSFKWMAMGLAGLGAFAVSACSRSVPEEAPPPPPAAAEAPPPVLAGGPTAAHRPGWGAMAPIPNPGDLSPAERARIYGSRHYGQHARMHAPRYYGERRHVWRPAHHPTHAWRPRAYAPAPVVHSAPAPAVHAAPAPVHAAPRPAPLPAPVEAKPLPAPAAAVPAPAPAAPAADPINRLKAGIAGEVVKGSRLDVPTTELLAGKEAKVTLSLPDTLLQIIQREAAKLGLGKAASRASVSAKLSGEGYSITPNGPQTARLAAGKAPVFSWMVHPTGDARKPLTASVDASLNGERKAQRFSLLTVQQAVSALPDMAADAADQAKAKAPGWLKHLNLRMLDLPGMPTLNLPVFGRTPSHNVVALGVIALILLLLVNIAGGASRRRARAEARRRRNATLGYGLLGGAAAESAESHEAAAHAHEQQAAHDEAHGHPAAAADEHAAAAHEHQLAAEAEHDAGHHGAEHHEEAEAGHEAHAAGEDDHAADRDDGHGHGHGAMLGAALGGAALGAAAAHAAHEHHEAHAHDEHGDGDGHDDHAVVGHQAEGQGDHGHALHREHEPA